MGRNRVKFLRWRRKGVNSLPAGAGDQSLLVMSTTLMTASCDSIGSCSLDVDVDADSQAGAPPPGAASLSVATLHSLLLSAPSGVDVETTSSSPSTGQVKKPSYLNLACSISGYGGITTYDSKLREGFRSRDHSPGRLLLANGATREVSPCRTGSRLLEPLSSGRRCWTSSPVSGHPSAAAAAAGSTMNHVSPTTMTSNGTQQRSKWLASTVTSSSTSEAASTATSTTTIQTRFEAHSNCTSVSTTVVTTSFNSCSERVKPAFGGETPPRSGLSNGSSSYQTPVSSKKSFIQQRVERLYGPGALAQGFFHRSGKSPTPSSPSSRVHNISMTKTNDTPSTPAKTPELPVLRHLRPEFREQLPVVGGASRRSFGIRTSTGSPSRTSLNSRIEIENSRSNGVENNQNSRNYTTEDNRNNGVTPDRHSVLRGSTESLADLQPAAPEVVLPVDKIASPPEPAKAAQQEPSKAPTAPATSVAAPPLAEPPQPTSRVNGSAEQPKKTAELSPKTEASRATNGPEPADDNPGYKFLKLQRQEIETLLKLAEGAEAQMEASVNGTKVLPEEALGHLRAAAGQARLLVRQKMVQFEGLCRKCMSQALDEPFPTTAEDLQGFWDMVLLQVKQVHNTFARLERLRDVNWDEDKLPPEERADMVDAPAQGGCGDSGKVSSGARKTVRSSRVTSSSAPSAEAAAKAADARKAREEQRRKMMEERRKMMKSQQQQQGEIEIFAPDTS